MGDIQRRAADSDVLTAMAVTVVTATNGHSRMGAPVQLARRMFSCPQFVFEPSIGYLLGPTLPWDVHKGKPAVRRRREVMSFGLRLDSQSTEDATHCGPLARRVSQKLNHEQSRHGWARTHHIASA
jgi:hypothetical protein